ncbi:MAG: hypothetical protein M3336_13475 [Chloroflexota bacterium]|nr:hypothetical protein [Chloroflexota bacterium]
MQVHALSVLPTPHGRQVQLKAHQCIWSGDFHGNSLAAVEECLREAVARAEIDIAMLADEDFLVLSHSFDLVVGNVRRAEVGQLELPYRPPLLSEVVALMVRTPAPTMLELDMMDVAPLPLPRLEQLAHLVGPVRERVVFNNVGDWNLRRLLRCDPSLLVGLDPAGEIDWVDPAEEAEENITLPRGAYGYFDAHPLARERYSSVADYLFDRVGGIVRLVPRASEAHVRLACFERMRRDGVEDVAALFQRHGLRLDVWTLDAGTPGWHERLLAAVEAGVDMITTNTPRELARAL